jgi:hypothetical protein
LRGDRIDETGSDRDVAVPLPLKMKVGLDAVHADIGDDSAWRDENNYLVHVLAVAVLP